MADAMCGPANPLQQFKQQTNLDRTLQQDRLTSRQSPAQGFRSMDPNAGILDPEFEAFQAGLPPGELANHLPVFQQQPNTSGPSQMPSWAADFQQMHISPSPAPQQQHFVPQSSHAGSGWAQGFKESLTQQAPRVQGPMNSPQAFQYRARYGMNGFQPSFAQPSFTQPIQLKGKAPATEQFDEAAFERAFDQAWEAMMAEERPVNSVETEEMPYTFGASTGNTESREEAEARDSAAHQNYAKQDYQMQLMLLEQQNKKRLLMARREKEEASKSEATQGEENVANEQRVENHNLNDDLPFNDDILEDFNFDEFISDLDSENFMAQQAEGQARQLVTENVGEQRTVSDAPQDFQEQLINLERQNSARLAAARSEAVGNGHEHEQDMVDVLVDDQIASEQLREDPPLGSQEERQETVDKHNDDDALAMTAQELLEKVEHNQTDKFRNSQFLSLMRRLRDREVKVEGDKMVETGSSTTATEQRKSVHFDNTEQTPRPIDSTPISYGETIPTHEQDLDAGRINPADGQEVVDYLNRPERPDTHDIGTSAPHHQSQQEASASSPASRTFPPGIFYADLRQRGWSEVEVDKIGGVSMPTRRSSGGNDAEDLNGEDRELGRGWERWDARSGMSWRSFE